MKHINSKNYLLHPKKGVVIDGNAVKDSYVNRVELSDVADVGRLA